jgi:hypothetical protein
MITGLPFFFISADCSDTEKPHIELKGVLSYWDVTPFSLVGHLSVPKMEEESDFETTRNYLAKKSYRNVR